jgi:RimJ/RimL family protein N-acetyltransferase
MTDRTLPIGPMVDPSPARRPARLKIDGQFVRLTPLDAAAHGEALWEAVQGESTHWLWTYLGDGPFFDRQAFESSLKANAASEDPMFFAIVDQASGRAVGYATLMRIDTVHRSIEVGNILYTPALQRTRGATEAMYLIARYVFEVLEYRRYEWKCNALNQPSRAAAIRLGFTFEGVFRQHMIVKGHSRDTAWFSMLDSEWPDRRAAFERWLDPANFDADGTQRSSLVRKADGK